MAPKDHRIAILGMVTGNAVVTRLLGVFLMLLMDGAVQAQHFAET
jgi:hypothetical protein